MDWFRKLFQQPETLAALLGSSIIGLGVGVANGWLQRKYGGWQGFFGCIFTASMVAVLVGLGVQGYIQNEALRLAIVGVCAVISDDIWTGLKTIGAGVRNDPLGSVARIIDAFRGRSVSSPSSPPSVAPNISKNAPSIDGDPTPMRPYEER